MFGGGGDMGGQPQPGFRQAPGSGKKKKKKKKKKGFGDL
jgi:signal recognition particle subunit SRP54